MNEELLRECFKRLRKDAAAGIDKMTKEMYAKNLEANLSKLIDRLHRMAYKPQPVRRKYIPKPGSTKQRPLGIPCFEDKLVQAGLVRIIESIYVGLRDVVYVRIYRENTPPHPDPPPRGGREILDLAKCKAVGGFSLAGATKYFCHERLDYAALTELARTCTFSP